MKKVLGLDLGTSSIGWALVNEAENENEKSSIVKLGVRIISYDNFVSTTTGKESKEPEKDFRSGKGISPNAGRTLKRSMRRNLQRYKLRRENLIEILKKSGFISDETILSENGNHTTFETYRLRAKATTQEITLEQFARVLLMINKKRGYKSSRKVKGTEDGTLIDGMEIAKKLYNENLTPGQLCLQLLQSEKKNLPDFYRSDLQAEFDKIFDKQQSYHPEYLSAELKEELRGKKRDAVWAICAKTFKEKGFELVATKRIGNTAEQKIENYEWRAKALSQKLDLEQLVVVLQQINIQYNSSSGYLGAISDRSKELYFNKQTVGEYQMAILDSNPNASLRNMVFYRQDYLDEFNIIWDKQAEFHAELTEELKQEIRDVVIFYQRRLKSQKGLISFCEFESREIEVEVDGKTKTKTIGSRVIPRSSPLFQEFKIWQQLSDIEVFPANEKKKKYKPNASRLNHEQKNLLFKELSIKEKLTKNQILALLDLQEFDMNFNSIDGNRTQAELFKKYKEIIETSGKEINLQEPADIVVNRLSVIFSELGYNTDILQFNADVENIDDEPFYNFWHLLYSFEGDDSNTGSDKLIKKLMFDYGLDKPSASILANVFFQSDYANLSAKAIRKILPRMKAGEDYTSACAYIYGKHSKNSLTKEELDKKVHKDRLKSIPKNSLRNPVVEKILNQMVNVVNAIIDDPQLGKPDEIRIELARELKKSADERVLLTENVKGNTEDIERIKNRLKADFPAFKTSEPSRNDIIRYKLWEELSPNGYKPLYGSKENLKREISPTILFSKDIEIEHIIPKARLFDDSFSNKTLIFSSDNKEKRERTAFDYVKQDFADSIDEYIRRIIAVFGTKTIRRVNKRTKKIETETRTFESIKKEHIRFLKNEKSKLDKWDKATEEQRKKLQKPWSRMGDTEQNLAIIEKYYSGKLGKLAMSEKDLPEGFINRDLANTQYIAKYAKTMLGDLVKFVVSTTGSITNRLREDWQLVDVMKEINFPKYEQLGLVENQERIDYETGEVRYVKRIKDWTKRNDHRHHAMDALTVAFTKRQFIQYLNNLNARRTSDDQGISNSETEGYDNIAIETEDIVLNTRDVLGIEKRFLERDKRGKLRFKPPFPIKEFRAEAKHHLENTLISIKAKNKVVTRNINRAKNSKTSEITTKEGLKKTIKGQLVTTPRGQLHNETIYGSQKQYVVKEEPINAKFDAQKIATVSKPAHRKALLLRLQEFGNDPKKAFTGSNSLSKKPIWLDELHTDQVPEKVKTVSFETIYTIRKDVSPDLKLDKVVDKKIKEKLQIRLDEFNGDAKKAFSNLDENPIWLNEEKGISIKRVTITGISNAEALHNKQDKDGKLIYDENGKTQPVDFINTGNNHHVAVYRDEKGNLQEQVVSFYEAVSRRNLGLPIIDKAYNENEGWQFLFSMKQNEYFVFPKTEKREKVDEETGEIREEEIMVFNPSEIDLLNPDNYHLISPNLFRVQTMSKVLYGNNVIRDYKFRHHLETNVKDVKELKEIAFKQYKTLGFANSIVKVRINHIGQIVSVGEY